MTLTLSAEMLLEELPANGSGRSALMRDSLTSALADFNRMLDAIHLVSRAQRRPLTVREHTLGELLAGRRVASLASDLVSARVSADPVVMRDAFDTGPSEPSAIEVARVDGGVALSWPLPAQFADIEGSPLAVFVDSLDRYAGTAIARLAAVQVQLERQGARVELSHRSVTVRLPFVERLPQ